MCTPTQGVWQPAGCVSCEPVCVCVSLVRVVIICPASTHTALVSSPSLAVLHLSTYLPRRVFFTPLAPSRGGVPQLGETRSAELIPLQPFTLMESASCDSPSWLRRGAASSVLCPTSAYSAQCTWMRILSGRRAPRHCSPVKSPCPSSSCSGAIALGGDRTLGTSAVCGGKDRRLPGQYVTVGALCDPTADVPFAALSDITRCLGPVFTAAARVDPRGSVVVGAASLAAAAGYITPRAGDGHPALLARHVLSMLKTTRSSFPACLRTNSFQNYSAEVETRAEYVGGTTVGVARDRVAEQRCSRAIAAKAQTLDSLLRALPRPTPPSVVYEAYRQLVSLYFPTDRRPMDLLLTDLDAQLRARLPTYQHAEASRLARDSSGGCPGFIYPLGPGTYFRTDHFAQQPSAAAF